MKWLLTIAAFVGFSAELIADDTDNKSAVAQYACAMYNIGPTGVPNVYLYYIYVYDDMCMQLRDDYYVGNLPYPVYGPCTDCNPIPSKKNKEAGEPEAAPHKLDFSRKSLSEREAYDPRTAPIYKRDEEFPRDANTYPHWQVYTFNGQICVRIVVTLDDESTRNAYLYRVRNKGAANPNSLAGKIQRSSQGITDSILWIAYETDDDFTGKPVFGDKDTFVGEALPVPKGYEGEKFLARVWDKGGQKRNQFLLKLINK